ncbi:MAG: universal stress protein [Verrucomicrobiota bacterium]
MKTLLVPLDFSDTATLLVAKAAELARSLGAKIILLHVIEPVASYVPVGATMDVIAAVPPIIETGEGLSDHEKHLNTLAEPLRALGLAVEGVTLVGLAVDDIVDQAAKRKADFIILGSHGHGALYHLFSGSVVTGVLRRAGCPVIVVPAKKAA